MAVASTIKNALTAILPKRQKPGGTASTGTFQPSNPDVVLTLPQYQDHLIDIFSTRSISDSRDLLKDLFKHDPDVSAAVNAYLTTANTEPMFFAYDSSGQLDTNGMDLLNQTLALITKQFDYTLGFTYKPSIKTVFENFRYMLLLRGGIGAELVFDKKMSPSEIRHVDMASIEWFEQTAGQYKPSQLVNGALVSLDIPTFFTAFFHKSPAEIYTYSSFVSAINTIAARQQVINDLYRIMKITGYPRMDVKVLEEVITKAAPANVKTNTDELRKYLAQRLSEIQTAITNIRPDQAFVHFDSVETSIINGKNSAGMSLDITSIVDTLNAQNQAALKTMATVIGRGDSGVNTASIEARIFSMNADELNVPIAELMSHLLTFALRLQGFDGWVECQFTKVELRPELELEAQKSMKQARLLTLLSLGLIDDNEFHIRMLGRVKPASAPELAGTGFMSPAAAGSPDPSKASPNSDPLGRSLTPADSKSAKSAAVKKTPGKK